MDGSNLYHPIITAHGVLSYADIASKSFPSPYSRFYDFEGLIYVFYGASGSCYSGYIIHYTKTSIEILHNLPYGHQRELFDIRTKEYIRWYNSYDFQNLVFEGVKIIKSSYINDSKTEYLIPYDTFPIFPNEVDSFTELPVSWISMFVSIPFLLSINRKRRQHK